MARKRPSASAIRAAERAARRQLQADYDTAAAGLLRAETVLRESNRWRREIRSLEEDDLIGKRGGRRLSTGNIINPEFVRPEKIDKWFPAKAMTILKRTEPRGLDNSDAWRCYWNSMLQCLVHAAPVYHLLGNLHRDCDDAVNDCMVCALQKFMQDYWNRGTGNSTTASTDNIHAAHLATITATDDLADYHDSAQNDPKVYLDFLHDQLLPVSDPVQRASVERVFHFDEEHRWDCVVCGMSNLLSQPVGGGFGFVLNLFEAPDASIGEMIRNGHMQGQIGPSCDSDQCNALRSADPFGYVEPLQTRYVRLLYCPDVLVIQLNRFVSSFVDGVSTIDKIMTDHDFEEILDLSEYLLADATETKARYRFSGVVAHQGKPVDAGHYIAGVRAVDGTGFRLISDAEDVESTDDFSDVQLPRWDGEAFQPYVLLYTKL